GRSIRKGDSDFRFRQPCAPGRLLCLSRGRGAVCLPFWAPTEGLFRLYWFACGEDVATKEVVGHLRIIMKRWLLVWFGIVLLVCLGVIDLDLAWRMSRFEDPKGLTSRKLPAFAEGDALSQRGPAAIPVLIEALHDEDPHSRAGAADALVEIGAAAVPALSICVSDPDVRVRRAAARALWQIGPAGAAAGPALAGGLEDVDVEVRRWSATALGTIGPGDEAIGRSLGRALRDKNPDVRHGAAEALVRMGPKATGALAALSETLD